MANDGGLSRIQQRLNAIPKRIKEAVYPEVLKGAEDIAADMRHLALQSKDTGALIESITITPAGGTTPAYSQPGGSTVVPENAAMVTVGNEQVRYPHLVEYGTTTTEEQPFFWPAVRLNGKKVRNRLNRAIRKAVRQHWGKS
ncbi:HK97 gp10 family phage protein [Sinorhizobium medicae]|uniref:HK97 gp10 family phage protein n=1 Tax=Sinorhizobium medicae TaxID=110321 RepID=UPI001296473A|nr:HK97 gp10 family phage protein [Sinorhizobium medicae]MQW00875.1 HK97 gp10 family phage protein [Sinorhizobium medicae]